MRFQRKIAPEIKTKANFISKKRIREDDINFENLRSYRLNRVRNELKKNMTITVESYIGKQGAKEGVKLEQQFLINDDGLELMSKYPLEEI